MQNILILNGSPRKNGNTSFLADTLISGLNQASVKIENHFLYDYQIKPCTDCRACKKGKLICTVPDGMIDLYTMLEEADIIIFATPIYWFGPSAQMKLLIDRLRPYYGNKRLSGKKGALLMAAGTGNKDCDLTTEMFRRTFEALGIEFIGKASTEAYDIGDAENDKNAIHVIEQLSRKIK